MIRLPVSIYSSDKLGELVWEVETLLDRKRQSTTLKAAHYSYEEGAIEYSDILRETLILSSINSDDTDSITDFYEELKALRNSVPEAQVVLAGIVTPVLRQHIIEWFRSEIHPHAMLKFVSNSDICGGIIVRIGARQYDFTFRKKIMDNKEKINGILSHV